ncbi:MAG: malonic semialdehyde reductase [Alphaproteobacteria bacterium]
MAKIENAAIRQVFDDARTFSYWQEGKSVGDDVLTELHRLLALPPTSANCSPGRFVFVRSPEAKARLMPALMEGNVRQTMSAPVTVIIGHDMRFHDHLPKLYPPTDAKSWFEGNDALIEKTAFRNGTLQGAYLIMAARSLGLDCGPMSGFDNAKVDEAFFAGTTYKSNFLCNLGYGNPDRLHPRSPRFEFGEACQIV